MANQPCWFVESIGRDYADEGRWVGQLGGRWPRVESGAPYTAVRLSGCIRSCIKSGIRSCIQSCQIELKIRNIYI